MRGLEHVLVAMADEMLMAYVSMQIMIQAEQDSVGATTTHAYLSVGKDVDIYSIFAVDADVILLLACECIITNGGGAS
jgi:hypothetical protein